MTITQSPDKYTPVHNPINFEVTSIIHLLLSFEVQILTADNAVIANQRYFPVPDLDKGTRFNLSSILVNYVDYEVNTSSTGITPLSKILLPYKVRITERYNRLVPVGDPPDPVIYESDPVYSDLLYTWNASLSMYDFSSYNYNDYYIHSGAVTKFLTTKPAINNTTLGATEYLYFIADSGSTANKAVVKTYAASGTSTNNTTLTIGSATAHRINFSPYITTGVKSLEVYVENAGGTKLTEVKTFKVVDYPCNTTKVNVLWVDSLGGVNSYTFINPQSTVKVNRSVIQTDKYKNNTTINSGIYNGSERTYNVNNTSEYNLTTVGLNDSEYRFLSDMLASEQVFIQLTNGLMPVKLLTTSADVKQRKYNTSTLRFELKFEAESGLF